MDDLKARVKYTIADTAAFVACGEYDEFGQVDTNKVILHRDMTELHEIKQKLIAWETLKEQTSCFKNAMECGLLKEHLENVSLKNLKSLESE